MSHLRHLRPFLRSRTLALAVVGSMLAVGAAAAAPGEPVPPSTGETLDIAEDAPAVTLPDQASPDAQAARDAASEREDASGPERDEVVFEEVDGTEDDLDEDGNGAERRSEVANRVHEVHESFTGDRGGPAFGQAVAEAASGGRNLKGRERAADARERGEDEVAGEDEGSEGTPKEPDAPAGPPLETPVGPPAEVPPVDTPVGPPQGVPGDR